MVGIPIPINSVGELPLEYLDGTDQFKSKAKYANALEILAQYQKKEDSKELREVVFHRFEALKHYKNILENITRDIELENYIEAERMSSLLIKLAIEGLRYYQTYDWLLLRTIVSMGYLGWMVYSLVFIFRFYSTKTNSTLKLLPRGRYLFASVIVFALGSILLYKKESPPSYFAYWLFPVIFWASIIENQNFIRSSLHSALSAKNRYSLYYTLLYVATLEFLVSFLT